MSQNHDRHFPPLAPGPRTPIIGESATVPRLKKNSTACQPCKQAKRKVFHPEHVSSGQDTFSMKVNNFMVVMFANCFTPSPVQRTAVTV